MGVAAKQLELSCSTVCLRCSTEPIISGAARAEMKDHDDDEVLMLMLMMTMMMMLMMLMMTMMTVMMVMLMMIPHPAGSP